MNHERYTCFYPLFCLPPSVFHFNTSLILSHKDYISSVYVIIPNLKYAYLDQDQCVDLFNAFGSSEPMMQIAVDKSTFENPFDDIKSRFQKDKNLTAYLALDEKTARSNEFNSAFERHDNLQIELVPSNFLKTSNKMRKAIETGDKKTFISFVPQNMTPIHKDDCWDIVHSEIDEQIVSKKFWKRILSENLSTNDIFDTSTTGMPNYDAMIKHPAYYFFCKDQIISLQHMSPKEYINLCASDVHDTTPEKEYDSIDTPNVKALIQKVNKGIKLDTPILNIDDKSQEGRHRSIVAAHFGCETIPVYVISKVNSGKQKEARKIVDDSETYEQAVKLLSKQNVPLDEKTYDKVKWKQSKSNTENK